MGRHLQKFRRHASGRGFFSFFLDVVVETIEERINTMSKELLDAVAGVAANVQKMRDAQAANHTQTVAILESLKNSPAAQDPDVATAIEQLSATSTAAAQVADDVNAETQAMAAAVAPPAPAPAPDAPPAQG